MGNTIPVTTYVSLDDFDFDVIQEYVKEVRYSEGDYPHGILSDVRSLLLTGDIQGALAAIENEIGPVDDIDYKYLRSAENRDPTTGRPVAK